jgi:hypothetical protein
VRRVDVLIDNQGHLVDLYNTLDLNKQSVEQAEVAAGDSGDCSDFLSFCEISRYIKTQPELAPVWRGR